MSYSKKTDLYEIPYMGQGDILFEQEQKNQISIIDRLLFAANYGLNKLLIDDGKYSLQKDQTNNYYRVKIQVEKVYSFVGILNKRLFLTKQIKYSPWLAPNNKYYIYVQYTEDLQDNPEKFNIVYSLDQYVQSDLRIKICSVDYNGSTPILDESGKIYAEDIYEHMTKTNNPHGQILRQDNLYVNKIYINNQELYITYYDNVNTASLSGVSWRKVGYTPKFVTVYSEEDVGNIWWKIEGEYVYIYNNGQSGKKLNLKIEVAQS